jgi:hypothetical protein
VSNFDSQIKKISAIYKLDWLLVKAVCTKESSLNTWAIRYEDHWKYRHEVETMAKKNRISSATEINCQKMSWGLMQVMGTVARELGFYDELPKLLQPQLGLFYGCKKLAALIARHNDLPTSLAAYNAGSGNIKAGSSYSKSVISIYDELKKSEEKSV